LARSLESWPEIRVDFLVIRKAGTLKDAGLAPGKYDVYILHEVPADFLSLTDQKTLIDDVEHGAGFVFLGGRGSFSAAGWDRSALASIMPMRLDVVGGWIEPKDGLRVVPEVGAASSSLLQLGTTADDTARIWSELPPLAGVNQVGSLRPSATLLARAGDGKPVLIVQTVGRGRVVAITSETWTWARGSEKARAAHGRFWSATLRWAAHRLEPSAD
jgi:uncharacterized membrane protein